MTYATIVEDLLLGLPELRTFDASHFHVLEDPTLVYVIFGDVLIPALEEALERDDQVRISRITRFLEDACTAAEQDNELRTLLVVEIGEWLGYVRHEDRLLPFLSAEAQRILGWVPGLATQRRSIRAEKEAKKISVRISRAFSRWKRDR